VNLNDLLTGAWNPFTPLATDPALSNNPQTLASLLTPQVQIPWASDDPTEPILSTSATHDPYAHFSDRATDSGASPGSAPATPAVQDLYALFSDRATDSGSPPGSAPTTPAVTTTSFSDRVPGSGDGAEPVATTSSPQDLTPLSAIGYPTAGMSRDQPRTRR
jgi:hypothetical protein